MNPRIHRCANSTDDTSTPYEQTTESVILPLFCRSYSMSNCCSRWISGSGAWPTPAGRSSWSRSLTRCSISWTSAWRLTPGAGSHRRTLCRTSSWLLAVKASRRTRLGLGQHQLLTLPRACLEMPWLTRTSCSTRFKPYLTCFDVSKLKLKLVTDVSCVPIACLSVYYCCKCCT